MKNNRPVNCILTLVVGACLGLLSLTGTMAGRLNASAAAPQDMKYAVQSNTITAVADDVDTPAQFTELFVDDGTYESALGANQATTLYFVNRLRPPSYPATLSQLRIFFRIGDNLTQGAPITLLTGANLDGNENIDNTAFTQTPATITVLGQFNNYAVPSLTINSGDFVVGFRISIAANVFPGALDTTPPSNRRSYTSTNGVNFTVVDDINGPVPDGDFGIRATVNLQQPSLSVSPSTLTFNVMAGGSAQSQNFTVQNAGSGNLNFTVASSDTTLATVSPTAGTLGTLQSTVITVFVIPPNQPGTRQAIITVSAPGAPNSPQTVTVIVNTSGPPGILNVSPTSLVFNTFVGDTTPSSQAVTVRNNGSSSFSYFVSTNNPGLISFSPNMGTLGAGQSHTVTVFVTSPTMAGTQQGVVTINAPGAQNSPQNVNVTVQTQLANINENEPNNDPPAANLLPTPGQGQSFTVNGDARPGDPGSDTNQIDNECLRDDVVQDWFRLNVVQRDNFQFTLSYGQADVDYNMYLFQQSNDFGLFPEGVQLLAAATADAGQSEVIGPRVLEPGAYFIGVSRIRRGLSDLQRVSYMLRVSRGLSREIHVIEDVACVGRLIDSPGSVFVVNCVQPTQYPARLEEISIFLAQHPGRPSPSGRPVRIIAFVGPAGSAAPPFNPALVVDRTILASVPANEGAFNTLSLGSGGPVINSGVFYVGFVADPANGIYPDGGRALNPNIRSFQSFNGQSYQLSTIQDGAGRFFNVGIRPTINTRPFGKTSEPAEQEKLELIRPRVIPIE
jgi:hypothetical protein